MITSCKGSISFDSGCGYTYASGINAILALYDHLKVFVDFLWTSFGLQGMKIPSYDNQLLSLAENLAQRLLPAFDTPTGAATASLFHC